MTNHISGLQVYSESLGLLTDFYQLMMAYGYWKMGFEKTEAVFHLFFRRPPFQGGFTVAAGLELALDFIKRLRFDQSDLSYLSQLKSENGEVYFPQPFIRSSPI